MPCVRSQSWPGVWPEALGEPFGGRKKASSVPVMITTRTPLS